MSHSLLVSPPSAPGLGGPSFGSKLPTVPVIAQASINGLVKTMVNMTVAEIKSHALKSVQRESRGATTINLIKTARRLYDQGREYDARSDLKAALSAYVKAACLIKCATESTEMQAEKSTGVVHKEFNDFRPVRAQSLHTVPVDRDSQTLNDLISRTKIVEEKLKATEVQAPIPSDGPIHKYGGNLADQLQALQDNGFAGLVNTMANMTVAEIKSHALESVTIDLTETARKLYDQGKEYDARSDLKAALSAYVKAACLIKCATESTEMQAEKSTGVVHKEFNDFRPTLNDLISRTKIVEEKLKATEVHAPSLSHGPIRKYGGSPADRLQELRDNGLAVKTTSKRLSSRHLSPVQSPSSPSRAGRHSQPPSFPTAVTTDTIDVVVGRSAIRISPTSLFGVSFTIRTSVACFNAVVLSVVVATFPPIDELDENPSFQLPSVPIGISTSSSRSSKDGRKGLSPISVGFRVSSLRKSPSLLKSPTLLQYALRNSTNRIERLLSTPITPIMNSSTSRPGLPSKTKVTLKSSNLSSSSTSPFPNGHSAYTSPLLNGSSSPAPLINDKSVSNSLFPKDLMRLPTGTKLLFIDVRDRADFQREHIKRDAVICIGPTILRRKSINATSLMEALVISPPLEVSLFANRENFDYVVLYDWNSTSFGPLNSPLSVLGQTIYEREFTRMLKHAPIILVGGLEAWKKEFGEAEVTKGDGEVAKPPPSSTSTETFSPANPPTLQPSAKTPFVNGTIPSTLSLSSGGASSTEQHQVRTPGRSRADTNPSNNHVREHRAYNHVRSLGEIAYPSRPQPSGGPSQLVRRSTLSRQPPSSSPPSTRRPDSFASPPMSPSISTFNGIPPTDRIPPVPYLNFPRHISPASPQPFLPDITSPPQTSINSSLSRKSDYIDQTQEVLAGLHGSQRGPIVSPDLATKRPLIRPPPASALSTLESRKPTRRTQFESWRAASGVSRFSV
ncbi:hypothetical protein IW262DRAFT_1513285 [Armillaria fumosa]|nr:hypothetical protein IW262DRAFT_1513285 [Armillaria fumosa]